MRLSRVRGSVHEWSIQSRPHGSFVLATSDTKDVIVEHYTWLEENMMPVLKHIDNVREARLYVRTKIESMVKDDESGLYLSSAHSRLG
jgi:hypothetical protein